MLLRVLDTLLTTRSLPRTARQLGLTRDKLAGHLASLRQLTGDRLVEAAGGRLRVTPHGLAVSACAREAIAAMMQIAAGPLPFEPARSQRIFRVGIADSLDPDCLPRLLGQLRSEAPRVRLDVLTVTEEHDFIGGLEAGLLDGVIGNWPAPPPHLRKAHLYDDPVVCLAGPSMLAGIDGPLTCSAYLDAAHIAVAPYGAWQGSAIEQQLRQRKLNRHVALTVPRCSLVPAVLLREPLLFTTGARFARFWAMALGLTVLPCPIPLDPLRYHQLWHERGQASAATRWLLAQCEAVIGNPGSDTPAAAKLG